MFSGRVERVERLVLVLLGRLTGMGWSGGRAPDMR